MTMIAKLSGFLQRRFSTEVQVPAIEIIPLDMCRLCSCPMEMLPVGVLVSCWFHRIFVKIHPLM